MGYWRAAAKFAWRDLQWARARPAFLLAVVAVSVASISGVRSAANVALAALHNQSRTWLAGDLAVTSGEPPDEEQEAALNALHARGVQWTVVTLALSMGGSGRSPDPSLLAVKAVDPAVYPFYGALEIEPAQPLARVLDPASAVVSRDALTRFHLRWGDAIRIGGTNFRVAGVIAAEPDRFSGVTALAVRAILSQAGFERSGLARSGDSLKFRILLRLPAGADRTTVGARLREIFPDAGVSDYRDANRAAVSILETTALFLNLTSLLALALGSMGVAMAARQQIEERAFALAILKTIGGRRRQLLGIFFLEIACLAALGFAAGVPLGWGIRAFLLSVAARCLTLPKSVPLDYRAMAEAAAACLAALAPTLAAVAFAIGRVKPAILLRREFEEGPDRSSRAIIAAAWAAPAVVLAAIAGRLLGSWNMAAILSASLAATVALAYLLAQALLAAARRWTRARALRRLPLLRHGIANLCRPGNRGAALIAALTIGLTILIATFQLHHAVTRAILESMPFDHPDMLAPVIEAGHLAEVRAFLEHQPGVEGVEVGAQARGRLTTLDGVQVDGLVGCATGRARPGELSLAEGVARRFGLRLGSRLEFTARGRSVPLTVTEVRPTTLVEGIWRSAEMDCRGLDPAGFFYHAAVHIRPDRIAAVRAAFLAEFPALPIGTAGDLSEVVGEMSRDTVLLARLVAWYALGSGLAVLAAMVSASRGMRLREMAVLSALGAPRGALVRLFTVEFAAMGVAAGLIAGVLGCCFTAVMVSAVLQGVHGSFEWKSPAAAIAAAGVFSVAAGWLPSYRLLRRKPLEILRRE